MAGARTLKLSILADVDNLKKNLGDGSNEVEGFGSKVADFGKKAGLAFAAAGAAAVAYAGKLAIDGVKAAIEDEAAQAKLAKALQNVTGATQSQIKAVEDYITKTSLATGVTDDKLRPSFERLLRSTKSITEATKLQTLALDIAAGTGKDLQIITELLSKAYEGNVGALKKLGVDVANVVTVQKDNTAATHASERAQLAYNQAVDKYGEYSPQAEKALLLYEQAMEKAGSQTTTTQTRTLSFEQVIKNLSDTFKDQASTEAETFQGRMVRLSVAFSEAKETIGSFILKAITPLMDEFVNKVIPFLSTAGESIGKNLQAPFENVRKIVVDFVIPAIQQFYSFIKDFLLPILSSVFSPVLKALSDALSTLRNAFASNSSELEPLFTLFKAIATFVRDTLAPIIGTTLGGAIRIVSTAVGLLIDGLANMVNFWNKVIDIIKSFLKLVTDNPLLKGIEELLKRLFGGGSKSMSMNVGTGLAMGGASAPVNRRGMPLFSSRSNRVPSGLQAQQAPTAPVINLTVNGAIDSEGTARQIVSILNSSAYRGTRGALGFSS